MKYLFFIFFSLVSGQIFAQGFWLDAYGGAMNYQGDLQDKRYTFHQSHLAGGAGITYEITDHFAARLHLLFGKVSADDKYGKNEVRNLNFTSNLFEVQAAGQYYIFPLNSHSITPYVFAGVALFHFNPYTHDTSGVKYFLKPLATEGEGFVEGRKPYSLTQFSIPFGGGIKLSLTDDINVGLEIGLRKTFTDYLDDVSKRYVDQAVLLSEKGPKAVELAYRGNELKNGNPYPDPDAVRGNPKSLDWYYFSGLTISFRLGGGNANGNGNGGKNKQYDCPRF